MARDLKEWRKMLLEARGHNGLYCLRRRRRNRIKRFPQLVKQPSAFYGPEVLLPFLQQPAISPYPELVDSRAHIPIVIKIHFNIIVPVYYATLLDVCVYNPACVAPRYHQCYMHHPITLLDLIDSACLARNANKEEAPLC